MKLAEADHRIVAITAAMTEGTGLMEFSQRFPDRFFDVGIAEEHAVTFAAGLAAEGWKPVVAVYSTFLQRAYDQILHDVALQKLPVVFAVDRAGLVGADGPTHHGAFDLSFLRHVPGLTLMAPSDENELQHALVTAFTLDGPAALRYPRGSGTGAALTEQPQPWPVGKGRLLIEGEPDGIALLSAGTTLRAAQEAVSAAQEEGIGVALFDARFVNPLDKEAILGLARANRSLVTVEENARKGGFGSAVLELLAENPDAMRPTMVLGLDDKFFPHGSQTELRHEARLDAESILDALRRAAGGIKGK